MQPGKAMRSIGRRACVLSLIVAPAFVAAQKTGIPVVTLRPAESVSRDTVGNLFGVRELPDGRVLVNDAGRRRLLLFDSSLAQAAVLADSGSGVTFSYGNRVTSIIPYLGDSTLFVDLTGRTYLVLDGKGAETRVMSPARPADLQFSTSGSLGTPGFDAQGRMVYRVSPFPRIPALTPGKQFTTPSFPDSNPLLRADFDTRTADTLAWLRSQKILISTTYIEGGGVRLSPVFVPLTILDDWVMLPDKTIAILRGRDYHIDWISPDGTRSSGPRMAFDWKRLSDDDKAAIVDSAKVALDRQRAGLPATGTAAAMGMGGGGNPDHGMTIMPSAPSDGSPPPRSSTEMSGGAAFRAQIAPASELPDYYPPIIRTGGIKVDPQGNIWILPTTSAQAGAGLLYDVVNRKGEVFRRVRLPAGRVLQGFGIHGGIYVTSRETTGTHLERLRFDDAPGATRANQ
jgi:hypothetical protein